MIMLCQSNKDSVCKTTFRVGGLPSHGYNGPLVNTQRHIWNQKFRRKFHFKAQPFTYRTGSKRIVERKTSRLYLVQTDTAVRTGKALTEIHLLPADYIDNNQAIGQLHRCFQRICQTFRYLLCPPDGPLQFQYYVFYFSPA